jgi:hypothetical protein
MTSSRSPQHDLAAGLAARLLHDISGPASGVMAGIDLLTDPTSPDLKESALELAAESGRALLETLEFCRVAYGGMEEVHDASTLGRLALSRFTGRRARLTWPATMPSLPARAEQALLVMSQIAAGALATGGVAQAGARLTSEGWALTMDGEGARARLDAETLDGLAGRPLSGGMAGRWAPGAYLRALVDAVGGAISVRGGEGGFVLGATLPTGEPPHS